ncbi:hypothetical protein ACSU1N_03820 [Thermogladius sp. 4427co]|uniref:hypothetical protein n=1 Tax=Thermogladius sp. 4427co TaxID=3450718 RepID=UPI003F79F578
MLQKLRDSSYLKLFLEKLGGLEAYSDNYTNILLDLVKRSGYLVIAYDRFGYLPAQIAFWFLTSLDPGRRVLISDFETCTYYLLPYLEEGLVIGFATSPYSSTLFELLQTANTVGLETHVFTPKPSDEKVQGLLSRFRNLYYIERVDELEASLTESIAVFKSFSRGLKDKAGARGPRLYKHGLEGFTPVSEELVAKYIDVLERVLAEKEVWVSSTKLLEPAGELFAQALRNIGARTVYTPLHQTPIAESLLVLYTSIEEYIVRQRLYELGRLGVRVIPLQMNTDPIEALVYFGVLALFVGGVKSY